MLYRNTYACSNRRVRNTRNQEKTCKYYNFGGYVVLSGDSIENWVRKLNIGKTSHSFEVSYSWINNITLSPMNCILVVHL